MVTKCDHSRCRVQKEIIMAQQQNMAMSDGISDPNHIPSHPVAVPIVGPPQALSINDRIMGKVNEIKVYLWPSLDDVLRVDGFLSFTLIFIKFIASIVFMTVSFWSFFIFLGIISVAPSMFFITSGMIISISAPIIIVIILCFLLDYILPDSPSWAPVVLLAIVYPISPTISIGVCFGLMGFALAFPPLYILTVFVYLMPFNILQRNHHVEHQSSWSLTLFFMSIPAIIPNFIILWGLAIPISLMSILFWIPLIVIQTYLCLFPCLCLVLLIRTLSVGRMLSNIRLRTVEKFGTFSI